MCDLKENIAAIPPTISWIFAGLISIAFASACSVPGDDYEVRADCDDPRQICDGVCVDTDTDPGHCGGCGTFCAPGEVCSEGVCAVSCTSDHQACDDGCFDLQTSVHHCGDCGNDCAQGEVCDGGICTDSCPESFEACLGQCIDTAIDPNHCGGCGVECDIGEVCFDGTCQTTCGADQSVCEGTCRDLHSDPNYCGACDNACPPSFSCLEGSCHAIDDYPTVLDGLQLWLRPDRQLVATGGVSSWQNASEGDESAFVPAGSSAPLFVDEALGHSPVVRFDGQGDSLRFDEFSYPGQEVTHTFVFVPAIQIDDHTDQAMTLYFGDLTPVSTRMHIAINKDGNGQMGLYSSTQGEIVDQLQTTTDQWYRDHPYVVSFRYDGDEMAVYVNGNLEQSQSFGAQLNWQDGFQLGASSGGDHFHGDIAEMTVFDRALEQAQLESLHTYLSQRYRLFFSAAPWLDEYSGQGREFIEEHELSEAQFLHDGFETIAPEASCSDHLSADRQRDGVYSIQPEDDDSPAEVVYCDMTTDDGGWTQIAHVRSHPSTPYPGRQRGGIHPDELGHSIDANGLDFSEIALTHNGLTQQNFATFELDEATTWDSSQQDLRFQLDDGNYAIFSLSDAESPGCGDVPTTCINSGNQNCTNQNRDIAYGAVSAGTGCCLELNRETSSTCGGWGEGPEAGNSTWTATGGRIFLR